MRRPYERMGEETILSLLKLRVYRVDEDGTVSGHKGQPVTPFESKGHLFVRLYYTSPRGKFKRIIALGRLAWMAKTLTLIPKGFEVHHEDRDGSNNAWDNLYCLHTLDHRKRHGLGRLWEDEEEPVPF